MMRGPLHSIKLRWASELKVILKLHFNVIVHMTMTLIVFLYWLIQKKTIHC